MRIKVTERGREKMRTTSERRETEREIHLKGSDLAIDVSFGPPALQKVREEPFLPPFHVNEAHILLYIV